MASQCVVYDLFPKPVGRYPNQDHQALKPVIMELCRSQKFFRNTGGKAPAYHTKLGRHESNLLDVQHPLLTRFYEYLADCANHFAYAVMGLKYEYPMMLTSLWINSVHSGGNEARHNHANSIVSGTYYANYSLDHAPLRFYTPRRRTTDSFSIEVMTDAGTNTKYGWDYTEIKDIAEGDLALWPSYIEHGYSNNGADNRISVSMNFMPSGLCSDYSFKVVRNLDRQEFHEGEGEVSVSDDVLRS